MGGEEVTEEAETASVTVSREVARAARTPPSDMRPLDIAPALGVLH